MRISVILTLSRLVDRSGGPVGFLALAIVKLHNHKAKITTVAYVVAVCLGVSIETSL
jgi:hypothetical protein